MSDSLVFIIGISNSALDVEMVAPIDCSVFMELGWFRLLPEELTDMSSCPLAVDVFTGYLGHLHTNATDAAR